MRSRKDTISRSRGSTLAALLLLPCILQACVNRPGDPADDGHISSPALGGRVLFRPRPGDAAPGSAYTRVIRLAHSGAANGRLLATFEDFGAHAFPIYESEDDGQTWTAEPIGFARETVLPAADGWALEWQPDLFELPAPLGDLPEGAILLAGNAVRFSPNAQQIQLYVSLDQGHSFSYRSTIATTTTTTHGGIWEPNIQIAADGRLVVYYSDETHLPEGYDQLLGHRVSDDAGKTFGPLVYDVAVPDRVQRPGMAVVKRLPNDHYVMSYECVRCGPGSPVHIKRSADGLDWGDPAALGEPVRAENGAYLGATPYITWSPAGGPAGMLIVSGMLLNHSPSTTRRLFANYQLGAGPWEELEAPAQWQLGNDHAGWSQALLPTADGRGLIHLASSDIGGGSNEILVARRRLPDAGGILSGATYKLTNLASGLCLDLPGASPQAGQRIGQWIDNGASAQRWRIDANSDGSYRLTNLASNLSLDDPSGRPAPGTPVQQWPANDASAQRWRFHQRVDGAWVMLSAAAGLAIDDPSGRAEPGTLLQLWNVNGATAQAWRLEVQQ